MDFWNVGLLSDDGYKADYDLWSDDYDYLEDVWDLLDEDTQEELSEGWWTGLID